MLREGAIERRLVESIASGEPAALQGIVRQLVRLRVVAVLQPVLDVAQEDVGIAQRPTTTRRQELALAERRERGQRAAHAQVGLAAAAHDLQRLHDELDLANAAVAELDVGRASRRAPCSRIWRWTSRRPS